MKAAPGLLGVVFLVVLISGCTGQPVDTVPSPSSLPLQPAPSVSPSPTPTVRPPAELFLERFDRSFAIPFLTATYGMNIDSQSSGIIQYLAGSTTLFQYDNRLKTITEIGTADRSNMTKIELYYLPEGRVTCTRPVLSDPTCAEYVPDIELVDAVTIDYEKQKKYMKEWVREGIIVVTVLGNDTILGKDCMKFALDIDLPRLARNQTQKTSFSDEDTNYNIVTCIDDDGVSRFEETNMSLKLPVLGTLSIHGTSRLQFLSFSATAGDVTLPVSADKIEWLPNFDISQAECKNNRAGITIIPTKKDFSAQPTKLNISYVPLNAMTGRYEKIMHIIKTVNIPTTLKGSSQDIIFELSENLSDIARTNTLYENAFFLGVTIDGPEVYTYCFAQ